MPSAPPAPAAPPTERQLWPMLLALCLGFSMSSAYRTVAAMMAVPLQAEWALSAQQLGLFAAVFHFAFGSMQILMGLGVDLHGLRKTILWALPLAMLGSALAALAPGFGWLLLGQALIGVGCAPAFLVCTLFIARQFPAARFAALSGLVMGLGGVGLLLTGTPLAWLMQHSSWRIGFAVLGLGTALAWGAIFATVREPQPARMGLPRESLGQALRSFTALLRMPHSWGILALASVSYASFITLRGLWLGPLLIQRHGFTLVQSGNVALAVSVLGLFGPPLFGRLPLQGAQRRRWIVGFTLAMALAFAALAASDNSTLTVGLVLLIGFGSGYIVLQYADVRSAYPEALTGRAMALFTMAMFLGIALMQWVTGAVAAWAGQHQVDLYLSVNATVALLLAAGAWAFRALPASATEA